MKPSKTLFVFSHFQDANFYSKNHPTEMSIEITFWVLQFRFIRKVGNLNLLQWRAHLTYWNLETSSYF